MKLLYFLSLFFTSIWGISQTVTMNGYVYDLDDGESIPNASIQIDNSGITTKTNAYGYYSLSITPDTYTFIWSADGFYPEEEKLTLLENLRKDIYLTSEGNINLDDIVVKARLQNKLNETNMGLEKVNVSTLNKIPVLLGERDVIKTIKLLPGLKSSGAGQSGLSVRGGSVDQNLVTLDEATVYNTDHLLGFFSTFNSDAIKDVSVYKGTAPAEYGGRVSSFIDLRMNDGNNQRFETSGGLGLIFSRLNVEGPIQKGKSSFLISGRRSYADIFLKITDEYKDNTLYFYDLNAKLNYKLSDKDQIFISGYYGRDVLALSDLFGINWGNITQTLRYNRIWNNRLFSNTSLVYSNFDFEIDIKSTDPAFSIISNVRDFNLKHEFQYAPNRSNQWKFGFTSTHHTNIPGGIEGLSQLAYSKESRKALESAAYVSNDWELTDQLNINYGLRISHFQPLNSSNYYEFSPDGTITKELSGSDIDGYIHLEPRLAFNYRLANNHAIKGAFTRNTQNMHLVSNAITSTPSDRWLMSSNIVKPQISDQVSLGYFLEHNQNAYEFSVETYYKKLQNQIDYKDAADDRDLYIERQLRFGKGRAYGIELLAKKNEGNLTGWLSYTWSKTEKQINEVNNNEWYFAKQDRPHDFTAVAMYDLNKKWNFSASFIYQTGNAVTYPTGKYEIEGQTIWQYSERNGYRMPAYHRLDLAATWTLKKTERRLSELVFSIYNVYGRENAFSVMFDKDEDNPRQIKATQISLFKYVPSISYNFKF
ncbi:MAG: TonB-dependent receptor [Weeksellaceae bacterium]